MIGIQPISDIDLSGFRYGREMTISCIVETCIRDVTVQIFKDDQLLDSETVLETVLEGSQLVTSAQLKVSEKLAGHYACQAMSEEENMVQRKYFNATGA